MKDSLRKMPGGGGEMQKMRRRGEEVIQKKSVAGGGGHVQQSAGLYGTLIPEHSHRFLLLHTYIFPWLHGPPYTVRPDTIKPLCHH